MAPQANERTMTDKFAFWAVEGKNYDDGPGNTANSHVLQLALVGTA